MTQRIKGPRSQWHWGRRECKPGLAWGTPALPVGSAPLDCALVVWRTYGDRHYQLMWYAPPDRLLRVLYGGQPIRHFKTPGAAIEWAALRGATAIRRTKSGGYCHEGAGTPDSIALSGTHLRAMPAPPPPPKPVIIWV